MQSVGRWRAEVPPLARPMGVAIPRSQRWQVGTVMAQGKGGRSGSPGVSQASRSGGNFGQRHHQHRCTVGGILQ